MILIYTLIQIKMIKEQDILWKIQTPKGQEKIQTITPEVLKVPDYDYWLSQNTLDAEVSLRNNIAWKSKTLIFTRPSSDGSWTQSFEWFWFKPTNYTIDAYYNWTTDHDSYSTWWYDWTNSIYYRWRANTQTWGVWVSFVLVVYDSLDARTNATHTPINKATQ